jgi:predicted transcriptional regulator
MIFTENKSKVLNQKIYISKQAIENMIKQRIIIKDIGMPRRQEVRDEVKWLCDSLGLMRGRDTENTSFKIMYELLDLFKEDSLVSTERVAKQLDIESPTINHHIRSFMETGIVMREKRKIALRGGSLTAAIEEMKRDSEMMFEKMMEVSKKIDDAFDLK